MESLLGNLFRGESPVAALTKRVLGEFPSARLRPSNNILRSVAPRVSTAAANTEMRTRAKLGQLASRPENSTLKLRLAQRGVSLTDHSDVGSGRRFETFESKLSYVLSVKATLLIEIRLSMVGCGGYRPGTQNNDQIDKVRQSYRVHQAKSHKSH